MFDFREAMLDQSRGGVKLFTPGDVFMKSMIEVMGMGEFAGRSKQSEAVINKHLKRAEGRFLYTDPSNEHPKSFLAKSGKAKKDGAAPAGQETIKLVDGAILQFRNVLTSKRKDRDGDVLHPMGANIDPKAPLLFQHLPFECAGKLVKVVEKNDAQASLECAIVGTPLGKDCATLVEFDALRISHGFIPIDYDQMKDENGNSLPGWEVKTYNVLEVSLVSIPANPDAVITAFNKSKACHPLMKGWGEALYAKFKQTRGHGVTLEGAGGSGVTVSVSLRGLAAALKVLGVGKGTVVSKPGKKKGEVGRDDEGDEAEDVTKKDGEDAEDDEAGTGGEADAEGTEGGTGGSAGSALTELANLAKTVAADGEMPTEAKDRMNTASNVLADIDVTIGASGDAYKQAADARDISEMLMTAYGVVDKVTTGLKGACEEIQRAGLIADLSNQQQANIDDCFDRASQLWTEVAALSGIDPDADAEDQSADGDDDATGSGSGNATGDGSTADESVGGESEEAAFDMAALSAHIMGGKMTAMQREEFEILVGLMEN